MPTVIWVHHKYHGRRYTLYLSALLYVSMVAAGLTVHLLAAVTGMIPEARPRLEEMVRFEVDYTFWLNLVFLALGLALSWLHWRNRRRGEAGSPHGHADAAPRHSGG